VLALVDAAAACSCNGVIVDGTKPGAPACSSAAADQYLGQVGAHGKPVGRNGVEVWTADGTTIDNLTACNFLTGTGGGGGNEIWWRDGTAGRVLGRAQAPPALAQHLPRSPFG
jgi:hypothetical protein